MTPFEYDENPWDGWGVLDRQGDDNIPLDGDPATNENGDMTIFEATPPTPPPGPPDNRRLATDNMADVIDWNAIAANPAKAVSRTLVQGPATSLNQTRGLVWGVERPELLITETMAFHDRRTEDLQSDFTIKRMIDEPLMEPRNDQDLDQRLRPRGSLFVELVNPWSPDGQLPADLYSTLNRAPNGSNTTRAVGVTESQGVELGRLSTFGASTAAAGGLSSMIDPADDETVSAKRSPVWRLVVVEEHPYSRQFHEGRTVAPADKDDLADSGVKPKEEPIPLDQQFLVSGVFFKDIPPKTPTPKLKYGPDPTNNRAFFEPFDPDGLGVFYGQEVVPLSGLRGSPQPGLPKDRSYVERQFYFTTDNSPRYAKGKSPKDPSDPGRSTNVFMGLVQNPDEKLRLPPETPQWKGAPAVAPQLPQTARYFIACNVLDATAIGATYIPDVPLAPIKPGRYAVVGSAGAQYTTQETRDVQGLEFNPINNVYLPVTTPNVPRFVTTVSRLFPTGTTGATFATPDQLQLRELDKTRRIELLPNANPELQQVFVAGNGGTPLFPLPGQNPVNGSNPTQRDNEVVKLPTGQFFNVFDGDNDGNTNNGLTPDGIPDVALIPPAVAVPVMNMSISEPLDLYATRAEILNRRELTQIEDYPTIKTNFPGHIWDPLAANGEGAYVGKTGLGAQQTPGTFNEPFDELRELMSNGTTRNYRTIHLQRLADPSLPWNPLPTLPDGKPNPDHDPKLPVNLYRTIDTASVSLTAFNGASTNEVMDPSTTQNTTWARWLPDWGGLTSKFREVFGGTNRPRNELASSPDSGTLPHRLDLRSTERGWSAADKIAADANNDYYVYPSARSLWRQEPPFRYDPKTDPSLFDPQKRYLNDMAEWRIFNTDADRIAYLRKRYNDVRIRSRNELEKDIEKLWNPVPPAVALDPDFENFPLSEDTPVPLRPVQHHFDFVMKHTLGFQNESFGALTTQAELAQNNLPPPAKGNPLQDREFARNAPVPAPPDLPDPSNPSSPAAVVNSTFPWLAWYNRPFISPGELLEVPAWSSSQMLRKYSTINPPPPATPPNLPFEPNPYDGRGLNVTVNPNLPLSVAARYASYLSPFGHLLSILQAAEFPAQLYTFNGTPLDALGRPIANPPIDADNNWHFIGAPHFYRILDFVQVPSRYVGTDDMLNAEIYNDVPGVADPVATGGDIVEPADPRYNFQPPFNKVSRERDPGRVNLNTVLGRRVPGSWNGDRWDPDGPKNPDSSDYKTPPRIWSEVYDGIMHRDRDGAAYGRLPHLGPAWRDVVISRKGYAQFNADGTGPIEKLATLPDPPDENHYPDVFQFGLNPNFPTVFANPFRPSNAGDLVPLASMVQNGVQVTWLRSHPFGPGRDGRWGFARNNTDATISVRARDDDEVRPTNLFDPLRTVDDTREAGFGDDVLVPSNLSYIPLFSERADSAFVDGDRNPYQYYQPMTRLGNLVTNRSNVYAIWITVGYFEVEKAPSWNETQDLNNNGTPDGEETQQRLGGDGDANSPATAAALALYNRLYPDGYMLGKEVGSDTGNTRRQRGFYVVDRSEPVGFKPGEDLNVERMIRLRRRIE